MKLHLGSGKRFIPGFKHIDIVEFPHVDIVSTIDSLPMIQDNSVDLIYNCHVAEHFNKKQVPLVLAEWYRILKPGGILRTAVPDFEQLSKLYSSGKVTLDEIHGPVFGRQDALYNFHWIAFDELKLTKFLQDAKFSNIKRYDWRQTEHAHIDDYSQSYLCPAMDKVNGTLISLNIEAVK